eukprot:6264027-Amphidinium_carterae.1
MSHGHTTTDEAPLAHKRLLPEPRHDDSTSQCLISTPVYLAPWHQILLKPSSNSKLPAYPVPYPRHVALPEISLIFRDHLEQLGMFISSLCKTPHGLAPHQPPTHLPGPMGFYHNRSTLHDNKLTPRLEPKRRKAKALVSRPGEKQRRGL